MKRYRVHRRLFVEELEPRIAPSAIYYVAPDGSDANAGTEAEPWATPAYAVNHLEPGDTLIIRGGRYILDDYEDIISPPSGTADAWITIRGEEGDRPVLAGRDNLGLAIDLSGVSYLRLENIEITHDNQASGSGAWFRDAIVIYDEPASNIVLEDLYIHHIDEFGLDFRDVNNLLVKDCRIEYCGFGAIGGPEGSQGGWCNVRIENCTLSYSGHYYRGGDGSNRPYDRPDGFGIEPSVGPIEIVNTTAAHNYGDGLDSKAANTLIRNCIVANNSCDGVKLWQGYSRIENTLIYGRGDGDDTTTPWSPIVIDSTTAGADFEIVNVTVDDVVGKNYIMYVQYDHPDIPVDLTIRNTIFRGVGENSPIFVGRASNLTAENNLFYLPNTDYVLGHGDNYYTADMIGQLGSGNLYGDPKFVSPAWGEEGDYHLQSDSPAIDAGTASGAPLLDIEGNPRDANSDIGCYEYQSSSNEWKWTLWTDGTKLRGANIYQARVYPELDGTEFKEPGPVGPPYTQEDFDRLAALGCNYVNISHPGLFTEKPPYTLDEDMQENLDNLLEMIEEADMFAVISFRTGPGRSEFTFFWEEVGTWFDSSYLNDSVWEDQDAQDAWVEMWRYTAQRYADNPVVVGYDLMVEPNSNDRLLDIWDPEEFYDQYAGTLYDWNQLYPDIVNAIREVDPDTPILVGGNAYSAVEWMPYLQTVDDPHIVYTFHQYEPFVYTHQEPDDGYTYPGTFDTDWDGEDENFNRAWIDNLLSTVDTFKQTHNATVAVNEFGVIRWAPNADDFMDDEMDLFEQRGFNYALWLWDPYWQPWNEENDEFTFRHGSDPNNHIEVPSNDLMTAITSHWALNTVRPSTFHQQQDLEPLNIDEVSTWAYQLQGLSEDGAVDALVASNYDMLVLEPTRTDWSSDDMHFDTKGMVNQIKQSMAGDGEHRKLVLAYVDIGEAEDWRWYWTWSRENNPDPTDPLPDDFPDFILARDPDGWSGNYPVAYWDSDWKDIVIYGVNTGNDPNRDYNSVIDEVIKDGFDGVYLDWVEAFENDAVIAAAEAEGLDPAEEMIKFIAEIKAYATARDPDFIIVQQNGSALLDGHPELLNYIDAIAQESIWFGGDATDDWNDPDGYDKPVDPSLTAEYISNLSQFKAAGKPVFDCEYAVDYASTAYANSYAQGYVPYVSRTPLSRLTTTPPPAPAPEITVLIGSDVITDGQATPIDFGTVEVGGAGATRTFTVRNDGRQTLNLGEVTLPSGFSLVEGLASNLAAGESDTFTVRLDATDAGTKSGEITFSTNDADENPFNFPITGTVVAGEPDLVIEVVSVEAPQPAQIGDEIEISATVTNDSDVDVEGDFQIAFYLSTNAVAGDEDDILLGTLMQSGVEAHDDASVGGSFAVPEGAAEGDYHVYAVVDAARQVEESDETNNTDFTDSAVVTVVRGRVLRRGDSRMTFTDSDGDEITVIYNGRGYAVVQDASGGRPDLSNSDIASIRIVGGSRASRLIVRDNNRGDSPNTMTLGQVTSDSDLGAIRVYNIGGQVSDTTVEANGSIRMLYIMGSTESFEVSVSSELRSFTVRGDFEGTVTVEGKLRRMVIRGFRDRLTRQRVGGTLESAAIFVNGELKSLTADEVNNSLIAAAQIGRIRVKRSLTDSTIHAGGTFDEYGVWSREHGNIRSVIIGGDLVRSNITAGVWLGENQRWDHDFYSGDYSIDFVNPNADIVAEPVGRSIIGRVIVRGTIADLDTERCGILAATTVKLVKVRGLNLKVTERDLPYPSDVDYTTYNGFLIDCAGRWI